MSSFNTHGKHVIDESLLLSHRWSHLRSCINKVSNLYGVSRSDIVNTIEAKTSVNCENSGSQTELLNAWQFLCSYRDSMLN